MIQAYSYVFSNLKTTIENLAWQTKWRLFCVILALLLLGLGEAGVEGSLRLGQGAAASANHCNFLLTFRIFYFKMISIILTTLTRVSGLNCELTYTVQHITACILGKMFCTVILYLPFFSRKILLVIISLFFYFFSHCTL